MSIVPDISFPDAVCSNRNFAKPTRSEFQLVMREALRTAKERLRHRVRCPHAPPVADQEGRIRRDFWDDRSDDDRPEETK